MFIIGLGHTFITRIRNEPGPNVLQRARAHAHAPRRLTFDCNNTRADTAAPRSLTQLTAVRHRHQEMQNATGVTRGSFFFNYIIISRCHRVLCFLPNLQRYRGTNNIVVPVD